jgi:hypothetical protein
MFKKQMLKRVKVTRLLVMGNIMLDVGSEFQISTHIAHALEERGYVKIDA